MEIESILKDQVLRVEAENRPPFESAFDYSNFIQRRDEALAEWKQLGKTGQAEYRGDLKKFYSEKSALVIDWSRREHLVGDRGQ